MPRYPSPLRYPGGKTWFIPYFRAWFDALDPAPEVLVEPYAGGASVGLGMLLDGHVPRLWLNDADADVAEFWQTVASDHGGAFADWVRDFRPKTGAEVVERLENPLPGGLEPPFQFLLRNRTSYGGITARGGGRLSRGENGRGLLSRWYPDTLADRIEAIHARRCHIQASAGDAWARLPSMSPQAAVFLDPPYPTAGRRLYSLSTTEGDIERLMEWMSWTSSPVLMTIEDSPRLAAAAQRFGLSTAHVAMRTTKAAQKKELVVANRGLPRSV